MLYCNIQKKKFKKMEKEYFRFYIKTRKILGISPKDIAKELKLAYNTHAPSERSVYKWIKHFKVDKTGDCSDAKRSGRPVTATSAANSKRVQLIIDQDPYCTYDQINAQTSFSIGSIAEIIKNKLKLKKIASRWVPHDLSEKNKGDRVAICKKNLKAIKDGKLRLCDIITGDESWIYHRQVGKKQSNKSWLGKGQPPRTVVKQGRFDPKTMFSIFLKSSGLVHCSYVDKGKTIDSKKYIEDSLKPLIESIKMQRPKCGLTRLKLLHDNARPHTAKSVITFLKSHNLALIRHPPYSPDLVPSDFWLFDYVKERLRDQPDAESLNRAVTRVLKKIPKEKYEKAFKKWKQRMEFCVTYKGEYFEHLINKNKRS
jgi:histone-lysine N-methyltransferase SETMAR